MKGESPEKEMLAHRVQTKYSLVHLICIAITLCIHMWTRPICVDPFILQSTWIVKFEQAKSFSFSFPFFSLIRDIAMHFVSCF